MGARYVWHQLNLTYQEPYKCNYPTTGETPFQADSVSDIVSYVG